VDGPPANGVANLDRPDRYHRTPAAAAEPLHGDARRDAAARTCLSSRRSASMTSSNGTTRPPGAFRSAGAASTAHASEAHEARIARFSFNEMSRSLTTSEGRSKTCEGRNSLSRDPGRTCRHLCAPWPFPPQPTSIFRGFASSTLGSVSLRTPSFNSAPILLWSIVLESWKLLA
jgi:hypothetical protein